ncbi:hypothetical protein EV144_106341 [Flavobacterium sp. 270]|uniref:hypothetical protein n=1 Tax=Flavobacterium sp. 270 TaxID=2512114 RepID=UPI001065DDA6|nr:hypothetical protein [Flavobacterium sp. 270]TDW46667.1 hypothetical protein EV144_106341 [Flavobacterium sp. 270]
MTLVYFLTGSYKDQDNDFELTIAIPEKSSGKSQFVLELNDLSSPDTLSWQTEKPTFLLALDALDEFLMENNIKLYSKILTTEFRDQSLDKELEGFILNRLEY